MSTSVTSTINPKAPLSKPWSKHKLIGVRVVWASLTFIVLGLFVIAIPQRFQLLLGELSAHETALQELFAPMLLKAPTFLKALFLIGLSNYALSIELIILESAVIMAFSITAIITFWRKPTDWVPVFVSLALLGFGSTIFSSVGLLEATHTAWALPVRAIKGLGWASALIVFYVFPDGRFVPSWTRITAIIWVLLNVIWVFSPMAIFSNIPNFQHWFTLIWGSTAILAQVYRYKHISSPSERQQSKWIGFGILMPMFVYSLHHLTAYWMDTTPVPNPHILLYNLVSYATFVISLLFLALFISSSVLGHRLWAIDTIINSTLVYGILVGFMGAFFLTEVFIFQYFFQIITGQTSTVAIAISTLVIAALFKPVLHRWKNFVDRRFYREKIDFQHAFLAFSDEIRTIIDLPELLHVLVNRVTRLFHISHGAVFLHKSAGQFKLAKLHNLSQNQCQLINLNTHLLNRLQNGRMVAQLRSKTFPLLVPLIVPRSEGSDLIGVLALGPRRSKRWYTHSDKELLTGLTDQAGTAIYVAQLIEEKQAEAKQKEDVEQRLEAHRNSPLGRAEGVAKEMLENPQYILSKLHHLVDVAGEDSDAASLVDNLPTVLENYKAGPFVSVAEGFRYLLISQYAPEVLPVGLRKLIESFTLQESHTANNTQTIWAGRAKSLKTYRLCQTALDAKAIVHVTELLPQLQAQNAKKEEEGDCFINNLTYSMGKLETVAESLYAYERVNTASDKLAYLASAVEQLRHIDHLARTELGNADRPIIRQITERWLTIVTGAMSDLQTKAKIVPRLLTRHTLQEDVVSVVINLLNKGRGAALNLEVELTESPDYSLISKIRRVKRLASGEETEIQVRLHLHLNDNSDRFRVRFNIHYTDPRGAGQIETFADVVHLLTAEGTFEFIPNPYVVGTPLQTGSPLFFGREEIVAVVQENLAAQHRNNLVLIGQRRTGKTSFLKQLPALLGDDYLPIYIDGQTLGLDPGLPNFFLTLATEIAFALEDCQYEIDLPELEDFADSPAVAFERRFLLNVRKIIGNEKHLLILLDEFEELEAAVRRGNIDASIFGFLRHLIQHSDNLSVIFCGTHRLEELASDYWNVLFNISLYRHIGALQYDEAMHLIQEPVAKYGMRYDDLALDKMWRVTAGHPYFLQLLCHSLVNRHNKTERNYMTVADANAALEDIMASGEAHFIFLWTESTPQERMVLASLSRMVPLTGRVTAAQIADYLAERGVELERSHIVEALHHLVLRDILQSGSEEDGTFDETYRWQLGLLGLWVEKYKSLNRVLDEGRN